MRAHVVLHASALRHLQGVCELFCHVSCIRIYLTWHDRSNVLCYKPFGRGASSFGRAHPCIMIHYMVSWASKEHVKKVCTT